MIKYWEQNYGCILSSVNLLPGPTLWGSCFKFEIVQCWNALIMSHTCRSITCATQNNVFSYGSPPSNPTPRHFPSWFKHFAFPFSSMHASVCQDPMVLNTVIRLECTVGMNNSRLMHHRRHLVVGDGNTAEYLGTWAGLWKGACNEFLQSIMEHYPNPYMCFYGI